MFLFPYTNAAQNTKISVTEADEMVENLVRKGYQVFVEVEMDYVTKQWVKKLKELGSVKSRGQVYYVENATMPAVSTTPVKVYSKTEATTKGCRIWYAIDLGTTFVQANTASSAAHEYAKKYLADFAKQMYIDNINSQIKDAEKVLASAVAEHEKVIKTGEKIKQNISKNRQEKLKLEQKLKDNELQFNQLIADSTSNQTQQKVAHENVEKYKKAVESIRSKLAAIE